MKPKKIFILIIIILIFSTSSQASTKLRKLGIGIRYGLVTDSSSFVDDNNDEYVGRDLEVQNEQYQRFPALLQLEEESLASWAITKWFFSIDQIRNENLPPTLEGTTYENLVKANTTNNITQDFEVPSNNTLTSKFSEKYTQFKSKIDAASNPSLSANYDVNQLTLGKNWGIFIPIAERHRLLQLGIGFGLGYQEGSYAINLCDPYIVKGNLTEGILGEYRKGICSNKTELFNNTVSNIGLAMGLDFYLYSFIEDQYSINFASAEGFTTFLLKNNSNQPLNPRFSAFNFDIISAFYHF